MLPWPGNSVVGQEGDPSKSSQDDHLHERSQGLKSHQGAGRHHPEHRSTNPKSLKPPKDPRKPSGGVMNGNVAAMKNHEPAESEGDPCEPSRSAAQPASPNKQVSPETGPSMVEHQTERQRLSGGEQGIKKHGRQIVNTEGTMAFR